MISENTIYEEMYRIIKRNRKYFPYLEELSSSDFTGENAKNLKYYYLFVLELSKYKKLISGKLNEEELNGVKDFVMNNFTAEEEKEYITAFYLSTDVERIFNEISNAFIKSTIDNNKVENISYLSDKHRLPVNLWEAALPVFATDRIINDEEAICDIINDNPWRFFSAFCNKNIEPKLKYVDELFDANKEQGSIDDIFAKSLDWVNSLDIDDIEKEKIKRHIFYKTKMEDSNDNKYESVFERDKSLASQFEMYYCSKKNESGKQDELKSDISAFCSMYPAEFIKFISNLDYTEGREMLINSGLINTSMKNEVLSIINRNELEELKKFVLEMNSKIKEIDEEKIGLLNKKVEIEKRIYELSFSNKDNFPEMMFDFDEKSGDPEGNNPIGPKF